MKMQVVYLSKTGNAEVVAQAIGKLHKCKCDQIPPAYPCEGQKLVFVVFENYGAIDKAMVSFCKDLTTARTKNVAVITLSNGDSNISELKDVFKANGVNVADFLDIEVKKSLFSKGKLTDANVQAANAFSEKVVNALTV